MAKVDVVVPCYDYGRFLTDCVRSVLGRSIKDVRVLVIGDAPPDDSIEIANHLAVLDGRVEGIAHARNQEHIRSHDEGIEWAASDDSFSDATNKACMARVGVRDHREVASERVCDSRKNLSVFSRSYVAKMKYTHRMSSAL